MCTRLGGWTARPAGQSAVTSIPIPATWHIWTSRSSATFPACGTVREANWAGVEQNVDNVISLTLDTLRGEGLIERAREAPYPKLQAALAVAKGS